jgi:DNA-binding SARP family transcriptional activator
MVLLAVLTKLFLPHIIKSNPFWIPNERSTYCGSLSLPSMPKKEFPVSLLRVHLFGKFRVECEDVPLTGLEARRVQELFGYLLLYRERPHSRERLAALLWGEQATAQSKKYLRQALWQLQTALDAALSTAVSPILLVDAEWIQINPQAQIWLDVAYLEEAFNTVQGVRGKDLTSQQLEKLEPLIALYEGDLLEGWYHDWCFLQRERLQNLYLALLDKLMGYCETHHHFEQGLLYGAFILQFDRARERTHRRLMRLQYLNGYRTDALRQYERCRHALADELGVEPAHSTRQLYEQIKADHLPVESPPASHYTLVAAAQAPLANTLDRLRQLYVLVNDVQHRLYQEIEALEREA